ncbi:MAG: acyl-CoA thioesterase [Proteobacteria bacterium]|nr:acyl-CoA thioesterase [Pseudomonadota bacterium]
MSIESEKWDHPHPFTLQTRVFAEDIDGLQHTNNTVYVKWCEQVAWAHSVSLGLDLDSYRDLNRAMAIIRAEYHYLRASHEGQEIVAATWITGWDKKLTMKREFQIIRVEDDVTLLRAKMQFACIDLSSGRPRRMPPEFIAGYGSAVLK